MPGGRGIIFAPTPPAAIGPTPAPPTPEGAARPVPPYTALAAGYDVVMQHVDYEAWADYVEDLFDEHADGPVGSILELGCGTGSLAFELQPLGPYRYRATDASAEMIAVARRRAQEEDGDAAFDVADFTAFTADEPADAVLLLYDGLNYVLDEGVLRRLFASVHDALRPGGLFVFDQSTPANSVNNEADFNDEGEGDGFRYVRRSRYDPDARLHTTTFTIERADGSLFSEEHVEHAYTVGEIRALAAERFEVIAAYDGFTLDAATDESERVHWVVRRV